MNKPLAHWCSEYVFVFAALIALKNVVFPFVLWLWFAPGDLMTTLQEATSLIFSVICIMILLGLGSISRFRYGLSLPQAAGASVVINLPFLVLWMIPATTSWSEWWWGIFGDGVQLWKPEIFHIKGLLIFPLSLVLILLGRRFYVREQEQVPSSLPSNMR